MDYDPSITVDIDFIPKPDVKNSKALILCVYDCAAKEYSSWTKLHSGLQIAALSRFHSHSHSSPRDTTSLYSTSLRQAAYSADEPFIFDFTNVDLDSGITSTYPLQSTQIIKAPEVKQHAGYDICTPSSKNLMVGDDPDNLPFLPFADDPKYDYNFDLVEYKNISWDTFKQRTDPDMEVILIETLRRLQSDHHLTRKVIDQSQVLPMTTGAIVKCSHRRDLPKWRIPLHLKPLPKSDPLRDSSLVSPPTKSPREMFNYFLTNFCNHPNCMTGFCFTHTSDALLPLPDPPAIPHARLTEVIQQACRNECILNPSSTLFTAWADEDCELLSIILETSPDALSCDIAPILKKTCRDVHRYRQQCLSSDELRKQPAQPKQPKRVVEDPTPLSLPLHEPCQHSGPCNKVVDCSCYRSKTRCWSTCRCNKKCIRRWPGCKCGKTGKICGTRQCSCFKAHMECDPELCTSCEAKYCKFVAIQTPHSKNVSPFLLDLDSDMCHNVAVQRNKFKATEVRQSKYGLGLFVLEACAARELIAEYIGEIIFEPTVRSRHPHTVHVGRCYVFGLAAGTCLDSSSAGNESRFINHNSSPNCESRLILVNGQHRIGIYAARYIKAGEELFIHYGSEFPIEGSSTRGTAAPQDWAHKNGVHNSEGQAGGKNSIVGQLIHVDYDRFVDDMYAT